MSTNPIVFFGDSLYDADEFWRLSSQILVDPLPDPQYYAEKFSDGEVQTQVIARLLGCEYADPVSGEDYNYAVGGARAIGPLTAGDFVDDDHVLQPGAEEFLDTPIDLTAQTERFLDDAATHGWDLSSFTGNMLIGINDLSNWEPDSIWAWNWDDEIADLVDDIVDAIEVNVRSLLAADIGEIWVGTQADETFFPVYNELDWLMELLSEGVIDDLNDKIIDMAAAIGDPRVHVMELEDITDAIEEDPLNFGIVDLENSILLGKGSSYDPELNPELPDSFDFATDATNYGFLDYVHPTESTHRILGIYQAEVMAGNWAPGSTSDDTYSGTAGDDLIIGVQGDDALTMRGGDDVALGGSDEDRLDGNQGSDLLSGGGGNDILNGGVDNDLLAGGYGDDSLLGRQDNDVLVDTAGSDILRGDDGDDFMLWFDGAAQGSDSIGGGDGADALIFYIDDSATYRAATREYAKASKAPAPDSGIYLKSLHVTFYGMERVEFVDASTDGVELPDMGDLDLALRLEEWQYWDFA